MATKKKSGPARKSASRKRASTKKAAASKSKKGGKKKSARRARITRPPAPRPVPRPSPMPGGGTMPDPVLGGTQLGPTPQATCRPKSILPFAPDVISGVFFEADPMDDGIWVEVALNPRHAILTRTIQSCPTNADGVVFLPASSSNICLITGFILRNSGQGEGFDRIQFKVLPCTRSQFVVGLRIKYEEDFRTTRVEKPRRKAGMVTVGRPARIGQRLQVPPQSIREIPDDGS